MSHSLQQQLESAVRGHVRFDRLTRALYATDASLYEIVPAAVVMPRDVGDVRAVVDICRANATPIVARGAGTGLAGGAVGEGVQLDFSRFMNRILEIDADARRARVHPGVVLDTLNAHLARHGLHFAPDVATSSRATIGGMIGNNSCGAHSVLYGTTVDHVESLTVVLADGSVTSWPSQHDDKAGRAGEIECALARIADGCRDEVAARFPKTLRRNGGYALDRICRPGVPVDPSRLICGAEGTLALVVEATLSLTPLPACKGLLLVHFAELLDSLSAVPTILEHKPAAVELVDRMLLNAARRDPGSNAARDIIDANADAVLIVELFADAPAELAERIDKLAGLLDAQHVGYARRSVIDPAAQRSVWDMRKRGLGLLMSRPGDGEGGAFVEDTAVDPARLRDYIEHFAKILKDEGVGDVGYYAHASVGEIHVRPAINLKTAEGVVQMHRIADRVSSLALEFGGANSGEHGDGIVRSCWNEKMFGPTLVRAFKEVKQAFDPENIFNPGKIVDPRLMTENLRFGPEYHAHDVKTHLDYRQHGGMAGLVEMCSGVGECRKSGVGTMCPSYITGDEKDTTRARANALRMALSNRNVLDGLDDPALDEVMDLCLMCKACKSECPTGVDMAKLKTEWLSRRNSRRGVSRADRLAADAPRLARLASRFPRISNLLLQSHPVRALLESRFGLDRRIPPPRLARESFRNWFRRRQSHAKAQAISDRTVAYFVDTWTNYYTPQVGQAAVRLLEAAGFYVVIPDIECCGRPLISKGLLAEAKYLAEQNIRRLERFIDGGVPIIGTEPSCILTLVDEYPQLVRSTDAVALTAATRTIEEFLDSLLTNEPGRLRFDAAPRRILYHAHCHQKAIVGSAAASRLLSAPPGFDAREINSGCCGMAGSFGHEKAHYDLAAAIGEDRLFPAIRRRDGADIAVSGFSCRQQIAHHTAVPARHVVEYLAAALSD